MRIISTAIVTTDPLFSKALRVALREAAPELEIKIEISQAMAAIGADEIKQMKEAHTELVFLDLEEDAAAGIRLAHTLEEARAGHRFIAVGPELSQDLLMNAMRAGITEILAKPLDRAELSAALERIRRKLVPSANGSAPTSGQFYAVLGAKGGVGATTVATNLAVAIRKASAKSTLLMDMAVMGDASSFLGMAPRFDFVDMMRNLHRMDAGLLSSYIETHESGVHLLSAPFQPDKADGLPADGVRKVITFLKQHYDYGVIDASRAFSPGAMAALEQVDGIFLVAQPDLMSLRNIKRAIPLLDRFSGTKGEKLHLVMNRFQDGGLISAEEIEQTLELPIYRTLPNTFEAASRSIDAGRPAMMNSRSTLSDALSALGSEITGPGDGSAGKTGPLGGLRKLFSFRSAK